MTEHLTDFNDSYYKKIKFTKTEQERIHKIEKVMIKILERKEQLNKESQQLSKKYSELSFKRSKIQSKAEDRTEDKCKHKDVSVETYESDYRDHTRYRCKSCTAVLFHDPGQKQEIKTNV